MSAGRALNWQGCILQYSVNAEKWASDRIIILVYFHMGFKWKEVGKVSRAIVFPAPSIQTGNLIGD